MAKNNTTIYIIIALLVIGGIFILPKLGVNFSTVGATMTRVASASPAPASSSVNIVYSVSGASGKWGGIISENLVGGCKFPDGTTAYKDAILSSSGTTKTISLTTPSSGTCTLTGYYQFSDQTSQTPFGTLSIPICSPVCTRPTDMCLSSSSNGCGGTCTWTVARNSDADTNCNNAVSDSEILSYITKWISGTVTDAQVLGGIQAWVNS